MSRFFYTLTLHALLPWALLHLVWRARRQPEYLRHWGERFGVFRAVPPAPTFWIHAVSVGETRAAQPLVQALRQRYPHHRILLTHMTPTGRATAEALFGDAVERVYLPYDLSWAVRRFLAHFRPEIGIVMETELWPNLVAACHDSDIPLLLVNARLSEKSARRYARWPRLTRETLQGLAAIASQGEADAERLRALGAPQVEVFGNLKFDVTPPAHLPDFRALIGDRPVFVCASTREGEEALILDAWASKVGASGTALLVIVPRHPQRFDEVARLIESRGLTLQRRSDGQPVAAKTQVWLGDSMGELFAYYAAADIAFVGGSLLDYGCQNLIEPCAVGTPVLIGPSTFNFAEAAQGALDAGAARQVGNAGELIENALALLNDAPTRQRMSAAGRAFAARHRGATEKTLALIARYMPTPS
ncbi:MAG: lipid IV(A) 3-deoxy-D-manno-octulosonic acid transferase [Rhodocyclaceae bacterium]|jgi:3-deoxy-D-manno-octulosonic-acid transferase|nr:lipid IV(A) 3-deoxy-D-manno-octulosonic acid transferase [Rhodocyclaceae bacterium]